MGDNIILKMSAGRTAPGKTEWKQYTSPNGIYVDVDTSAEEFSGTVLYVVSLGGVSGHWATTGGSCVYNSTPKGFRVYVRAENPITPETANNRRWHINWIGTQITKETDMGT